MYQSYSTEDFIQDEFFQQWVYAPNGERNAYWTDFLLTFPTQRNRTEEAREFLLSMNFERDVPESIVQKIRSDFNQTIDRLEGDQMKPLNDAGQSRTVRKMTAKFYRIAASLLLLSVFFIGYLLIRNGNAGDRFQTYEGQKTPRGKQQHLVLEEGTHVWLNANSELRYAKHFSKQKNREVFLTGEAFFDVSENKNKPFIVHTSGLAIRVLGTAFNVRSYAEDHVVETTLVRGKVSIVSVSGDSTHQVTLLPNEQALFSKDSKKIALEKVLHTEDYTAWKNGWMIFDNKPFSHIKETLERWYNVTIVMEDEQSLACTFSAKFKDKTLQEVLEIFRNTESINYLIEGDRVSISGKLCEYENPN